MPQKPKRKRRSDRLYVIYQVTCKPTGLRYIGMVVKEGTIHNTLRRRLYQHIYRAGALGKDWTFHEAIREYGGEAFKIEVIETCIGKANAHEREVALIKAYGELNTNKKGGMLG